MTAPKTDVVVQLRYDKDPDHPRLVVLEASPTALVAPPILRSWYAGKEPVKLERHDDGPDVVRFGTPGEELGEVAYEILGHRDSATPVQLRRIE